MAAASGSKASPRLLEVPPAAGQIAAIGATTSEGIFVAFVLGSGLQYLQLSAKSRWVQAARSSESVAGAFGLHVHSAGGAEEEEEPMHVSFVDAPRRAWVCLRIPAASSTAEAAEAEEVGRVSLPSEVVAACSSAGDPAAAIALRSGSVRFLDLAAGKAAGKGLKLEPRPPEAEAALARLAADRVALVRRAASQEPGLEFSIVSFDRESEKAVLQLQGTLCGGPLGGPGTLEGAAATAPAAGLAPEDRVVLCWRSEGRKKAAARGYTFASAALDREAPQVLPLPSSQGVAAWCCFGGYVAEWSPAAGGGTDLQLTVRDTRFGMTAASGALPLPAREPNAPLLVATAAGVSLLVGRTGSSTEAVGVQWLLPSFSLQMLIGRSFAQQSDGIKPALGPLQEVVSGKRQRDDPAIEEMFSSKRHAATDKALASAVRRRSWVPSLELVNEVVHRRSWGAACALLSLPELEEDLSIKLLSARPELLARVVRRARAPHQLERALRDNLPASQLPKVLEVLLNWLDAYRNFPEECIRKEAPGVPEVQEIITFLGALADGCLPMLAQLEVDLLERMLEATIVVQKRCNRVIHLYATLREAYRIRKPLKPLGHHPAIEAVFFGDF